MRVATFVLLAASVNAFSSPVALRSPQTALRASSNDEIPQEAKIGALTSALWIASAQVSQAAGPDWGIFEGRTGSLLHPLMMGGLALLSGYTALLGFQWRRQRTLGDEISALKKTLPDLGGASSVSEAISVANEAGDTVLAAQLRSGIATEKEIASLTQERKDLAAAGPRDKHFSNGALLAFLGTAFAIEVWLLSKMRVRCFLLCRPPLTMLSRDL